jgi:hypothetical protein
MKKYLKSLLLLILVAISITSCRKTSNSSNSNTTNDGTLLSEFVMLDTTQAIGSDTLAITYLTYDNSKRLSTVSYIFFTNYIREAASYSTRTFFYNGTDTLYNKLITSVLEAGPSPLGRHDTDYVSYDSQGRIVKDIDNGSSYDNTNPYTNEDDYSYAGSAIINNHNGNIADTITQTVSNGNVVTQVDNNGTTCSILLDKNPNPFYKNGFEVTPIYGMYEDPDVDGIQDGVQKNNCVDFNQINTSTNDLHVTHQFIYKSNGYPSSVIEYNTQNFNDGYVGSNTPAFNYKGIYIYQ